MTGVRRIMKFNLALLEKWSWRMYVGQGSLWYKVLGQGMSLKVVVLRKVGCYSQFGGNI